MKFAHFSHVWAKPGMTPHRRYEQLWRELQLCDETGFDYSFCVEHHFRPDESWMSSPSLYAVGAGARTKRLRIGPMGYIVPLYHPLRLAEEIALVDQMLGGRMELGLVPGINADYFRPFGLDYGARKSPTLEFVDYLRAAFGETQPFSFRGKAFHTEGAELAVMPAQRPHPPLWMMSSRSADAGILRPGRDQSGLLSGLPARRGGTALSQVSARLEAHGPAAKAEHRLQLGLLCRRNRPEGARYRAVACEPRLRGLFAAGEVRAEL